MKTYEIPDNLLAACISLIERLPAAKDVRAVLNGIEMTMAQQDARRGPDVTAVAQASGKIKPKGGGGPGEEKPPK